MRKYKATLAKYKTIVKDILIKYRSTIRDTFANS